MAEALKMKVDTAEGEPLESYNLPDARDGLTPRQRRILWTMRQRKLSSRSEYEMTAKTLYDAGGQVGTISDHWGFGEADTINNTIALMTEHFNTVPLIDAPRGNWGQHGGNPTSPRFTEIRLHAFAEDAMLKYISKRMVDFKEDTGIACGKVPLVLPARIPGSIVLGTDVIADGFYSQIPPDNLGEVIDAMIAMINDPDLAPERVLDYINGPDFITGGVIVNKSELPEMYRTGRGQIRVRCKSSLIRPFGKERPILAISEVPVTMDRDIDAFTTFVDKLVRDRELPGVVGVYSKGWFPEVEFWIELKADADTSKVLDLLYLKTDLEDVIDYQAILLSGNEPARMSMYNILSEHLAFYRDFLQKKNGVAPTNEEMCQELLTIKKKYAKPRKTEIVDLV